MNYGFRFYKNLEVVTGVASLGSTRVWKGKTEVVDGGLLESVTVVVPRTQATPEVIASFDDPLQAPINKGDAVGQLQVFLDGELLLERPLQALQNVESAGFFKRLWDGFLLWLSQIFSP